jgi:type IV pilus assembly protein PilB
MAIPTPVSNLSGLALRLVREGYLPAADATRLQSEANTQKLPLITHLVNSKKLNSGTIAKVASEEFGVPLFDVTALDTEHAPFKLVSEKILRKHKALPLFKRGNKLYVAVADPTNLQGLDEIKFNTGLATEPVLVDEAKLSLALDKMLEAADTSLTDFAGGADDLEGLDIGGDEDA